MGVTWCRERPGGPPCHLQDLRQIAVHLAACARPVQSRNKKPAGVSQAGFGRTCPSANIVIRKRASIRNLHRTEKFPRYGSIRVIL